MEASLSEHARPYNRLVRSNPIRRSGGVPPHLGGAIQRWVLLAIGVIWIGSGAAQAHPASKPTIFPQLGHSQIVGALAFSPDGKLLASGDPALPEVDHTIKILDVASGRELETLVGHTSGVHALSFSPSGKLLASGSDDG